MAISAHRSLIFMFWPPKAGFTLLINEYHRIVESFRLEKSLQDHQVQLPTQHSQIHHYNTSPKCHIHLPFKCLLWWWFHCFPGQLFQCLTTLLVKKCFIISNLNLPWHNLKAIYSHPVACCLGKGTNWPLATPFFQIVVKNSKIPPELPFFHAKQHQFPQPLLIRFVLQTLVALWTPVGALAPQYLSCSERLETEHGVWGAASLV